MTERPTGADSLAWQLHDYRHGSNYGVEPRGLPLPLDGLRLSPSTRGRDVKVDIQDTGESIGLSTAGAWSLGNSYLCYCVQLSVYHIDDESRPGGGDSDTDASCQQNQPQ